MIRRKRRTNFIFFFFSSIKSTFIYTFGKNKKRAYELQDNFYELLKPLGQPKVLTFKYEYRILIQCSSSISRPKKPQTLKEADFDDPETTELQIKYLKKLGYKVFPIEANEEAYFKLYRLKSKIDLVFNVSEGLHGNDREAQIPAMLEMLQIPYTGSSPLAQAIVLNKSKAKRFL